MHEYESVYASITLHLGYVRIDPPYVYCILRESRPEEDNLGKGTSKSSFTMLAVTVGGANCQAVRSEFSTRRKQLVAERGAVRYQDLSPSLSHWPPSCGRNCVAVRAGSWFNFAVGPPCRG